MKRYFIHLSYVGTNYNGWQKQKSTTNSKSVQQVIEHALSIFLRQPVDIVGCGRTDSGVHARDYIAHVDLPTLDQEIEQIVYRVNKILPKDIVIHRIIEMPEGAHARFDASSRSYQYRLHTKKDPFIDDFSFFYTYGALELETLNNIAKTLLEYNDFAAFCKSNSDNKTTICKITKSYWIQDEHTFIYHITGDRFLRGMIRLIVGMSIHVATKKLSIETVKKALEEKSRLALDWSVPACGLTLYDIKYPYDV